MSREKEIQEHSVRQRKLKKKYGMILSLLVMRSYILGEELRSMKEMQSSVKIGVFVSEESQRKVILAKFVFVC